jgi:hypothetical protein
MGYARRSGHIGSIFRKNMEDVTGRFAVMLSRSLVERKDVNDIHIEGEGRFVMLVCNKSS